MAENKQEPAAEEKPEAEQSVSAEEELPNEEAEAEPRKKSRLGPWLFLLLILIGLPAAWYFSPAPQRDQVLHWLGYVVPPAQPPAPVQSAQVKSQPTARAESGETTAESTPEPASPPSQQSASMTATETAPAPNAESAPNSTPQPAAQTATTSSSPSKESTTIAAGEQTASKPAVKPVNASGNSTGSISPKQAKALLEQIKQLQAEVAVVQAGQAELHRQMEERQQMELRNRLRWLSRPGISLAQQAAMWSDIAALPELNNAQRSTAEAMAKLAQDDLLHVAAWRRILTNLAESLPKTQQSDVLPKSQNKYLAWLIDAFHLHHAPAESDQQRAYLARQTLAMAQSLANGDWPTARAWRDLLMALQHQFGDNAKLGLPESIDVQQHLASMRENAATWLEKL